MVKMNEESRIRMIAEDYRLKINNTEIIKEQR
jgi:hypothetical protein